MIREGRRTGQLQSRLVTSPAEIPRPPVDLHTIVEGPGGGTDGPTGALGAEYLEEELCGLRFRISHRAFFQTNTEMAERLYGIAAEMAGLTGTERVFDLFCGIGTLGLTLASRAGEVWGIEIVPEAIVGRRGERRGSTGSRTRASAPATRARRSARCWRRPASPDVVVVDPPRAGLSQEGGAPPDRVRGAAHRLRLLQPDHPRPERRAARGGRL